MEIEQSEYTKMLKSLILTFEISVPTTFPFMHAPVVTHIVAMFQTTSVWIVLTHIDILYNKRKH